MSKLTTISANNLTKILKSIGFRKDRTKGSHEIWKHPDGRLTAVPNHSGEKISKGLLLSILKDVKLTRDEYFELLKK